MLAWDLSRADWQERIRANQRQSLLPDLPHLDRNRAALAEKVFNKLRLADVPGNPTMKDAAGDWFREIVGALHGSLLPDAVLGMKRWIQEVFLLVPKKNSKTSNGAELMLTSLLLNKRPKAKFILVAPTHDITEMAFAQVEGAIALDPQLQDRFHVQTHLKKVTDKKTKAFLEVLSFDPSVLTGQKHAGALIDELHVVGGMQKAASAIGQLRGGMVSYPESFLVFITTQSEKPPAGVFKAELTKAREIRDGKREGAMLPVLYEFPDDIAKGGHRGNEAWRDRRFWAMVTPNAGRSITIDRLASDYADAVASSPEELHRWASQHLNIEIGLALGSDAWAGARHWEKQADETLTLADILARSEVITAGIDGGGLDDLLGLAILGRERETRRWLLWTHAWAHRGVLELRKSEAARLLDLEKGGDLTIVDRMEDAYGQLADYVEQVNDLGLLNKAGLDPVGVKLIVDELSRREISQESKQVEAVRQGYTLTGTIKSTEAKLSDGELVHCGQPLMAWCVSNAKVEPKGNAVVVTKQASGTGKIDPLMATFNAVELMSQNPEASGNSGWNTDDLDTLMSKIDAATAAVVVE
jgi:phage terminase large subunit-like protein